MDFQRLADKALQGILPEREELREVLNAPDEQLPEILSAAFKVRHHYYGKRVQIHVLQNAKSGLCPEDCHYCSQSSVSEAPVDKYIFMSKDKLVESARQAKAAGAVRFCIVNSGRGPTNKEIDDITAAVREIRAQTGMNVCCSLGLMNDDKTRKLAAAGVDRVNHNLNTSREHHADIVTTHSYDDRVATIESVKSAGIGTCSGGIIGMGESDDDIINLGDDATCHGHRLDPGEFFAFNSQDALRGETRTDAAALLEDALPVPLRQSDQRDPRRRRPRSELALAATAKPLPRQLDVRQRLLDHARPRRHRRAPDDPRSRF